MGAVTTNNHQQLSALLQSEDMSTVLNTHAQAVNIYPASDLFLRHRLQIVEEVWELVLREECGQQMVDLLRQLRDLCSPEGQATDDQASSVSSLIEKLSINEAIRAARGFALYFQLINIVEQDYEQKQQLTRYEDSEESREEETLPKIIYSSNHQLEEDIHLNERINADLLVKNWQAKLKDKGTFAELFPKLFKLNVPPAQIQRLIAQLDVRLVFTAHPTEIVRPTIREKQRRVVNLLQKVDASEKPYGNISAGGYSWETFQVRSQLLEEIRLWWRTDELHQFKPSVLDEVDYALHYFQEVLFEATPQLYERLKYALNSTFPRLEPPIKSFCKFGSWVGSDRDGNPSVTPEITWQTACYQRHMVLKKYIDAATGLIELLSVSLHWSDVLPDLLESLEIEQSQMSEVYDALALRYRQEPYRLKLAYVVKRLENTQARNSALRKGEILKDDKTPIYHSVSDFLADLRLIQRNLSETGLKCQQLETLLTQVEIFGFNLTQLDIRQESTRHSDAIGEIIEYLGVLETKYDDLPEEEKIIVVRQLFHDITSGPFVDNKMFDPQTGGFVQPKELNQETGEFAEHGLQRAIDNYAVLINAEIGSVLNLEYEQKSTSKKFISKVFQYAKIGGKGLLSAIENGSIGIFSKIVVITLFTVASLAIIPILVTALLPLLLAQLLKYLVDALIKKIENR